jgi:hypothetical protein
MRYLPIVLLVCLVGCAQPGGIRWNPFTGEMTLRQPPNAKDGAYIRQSPDGTLEMGISGEREPSANRHLWFLPWLGAALMGLGLVTLVLRSWFQTVPLTASLAALGLGALFIFLPTIVQEAWWLVAGGLGLLALMYGIAWLDNRTKLLSKILPSS